MSEFEKKSYIDDEGCPTEGAVLKRHWHQHKERITSLESHNRELLAVIAAKDEALRKIHNGAETKLHAQMIADEALALNPSDVELIDAFYVLYKEWDRYKSTGEGTKFYILQKKEGK